MHSVLSLGHLFQRWFCAAAVSKTIKYTSVQLKNKSLTDWLSLLGYPFFKA